MLLQPLARLVGEHIVSGDVAGLAGGIDDIIPALVVGSSCWEIYLCLWSCYFLSYKVTMNQYTLRNRFRSKRLCETSETGETHYEPPPPAAQVSYMQPLRDKLALLSHGRQNLTQANAVLMEVMLLFIATIFLIFLCRMHSSYYREAR